MADILNIELTKTQLPNGKWLLYYDGSDIDLECGVQYIKVNINGIDWFSELFTIKNINYGVHPELIKDNFHQPIRFYDNKLKQTYYKCNNLCDIGLINPIDHIIPFVIDITGLGAINTLETKIICHDGSIEYDLSEDLNYIVNGNIIYQDGGTLSGQLFCGIYYLQVKINNTYFYSEHFKVENITNVIISNLYLYTEHGTPEGFLQIDDDEGNPIKLSI